MHLTTFAVASLATVAAARSPEHVRKDHHNNHKVHEKAKRATPDASSVRFPEPPQAARKRQIIGRARLNLALIIEALKERINREWYQLRNLALCAPSLEPKLLITLNRVSVLQLIFFRDILVMVSPLMHLLARG